MENKSAVQAKDRDLFPDRASWQRHVSTLKTEEQLNGAVDLLFSARAKLGIHRFYQTNEIGLAKWDLDQQARRIGFDVYKGRYRKSLTAHVK